MSDFVFVPEGAPYWAYDHDFNKYKRFVHGIKSCGFSSKSIISHTNPITHKFHVGRPSTAIMDNYVMFTSNKGIYTTLVKWYDTGDLTLSRPIKKDGWIVDMDNWPIYKLSKEIKKDYKNYYHGSTAPKDYKEVLHKKDNKINALRNELSKSSNTSKNNQKYIILFAYDPANISFIVGNSEYGSIADVDYSDIFDTYSSDYVFNKRQKEFYLDTLSKISDDNPTVYTLSQFKKKYSHTS